MGSSCHQRLDDRGCQLLGRRRRNAHANVAAELDLQRRRAGHRSLVRPRRDHHLSKSCRGGPQIAPPSINLPRNDIHAPGNLANRRAQCKSLRDDRPLLLRAPPPAPLRARQHLNSAHRTVSCTSASHSACTGANRRRISPARARRPLTDGYGVAGCEPLARGVVSTKGKQRHKGTYHIHCDSVECVEGGSAGKHVGRVFAPPMKQLVPLLVNILRSVSDLSKLLITGVSCPLLHNALPLNRCSTSSC